MRDELSLAVVGARFDNPKRKGRPTGNRQAEILMCVPGDPVMLEPEPTNKADQNAIAVYSMQGVQIGYISADRTALIRNAWGEARTVRAVFQEATAWGCAIRVTFDGNVPSLPPVAERTAMRPDDGWWPDEAPAYEGVDWIPPEE